MRRASALGAAGSFYEGVALSVAGMLSSPEFLFREEIVEPDPDRPGQPISLWMRILESASHLSFFLWNWRCRI